MKREKLKSRLGFILISAGCAIGIGNVWKFPYMAGQHGGGIFVLFYLIFLLLIGVPILVVEFSVGRAAQASPVKMFQKLEKPGSKWHIHGYVCLAGNYLIMMYYTTVAGWMLYYLYASLTGKYSGMDAAEVGAFFDSLLASPLPMILCMGIVTVLGFAILSVGLQNGLEKITKIMMVILMVLIAVLAVHSIFLKGGAEGLKFYLIPDMDNLKEVGIGKIIRGAVSQAFFTLSLGMGAMAIFGSYIKKDHALLGESIPVTVLDTIVALCSGFIIFPVCAAFGVAVDSGPGLLFITLPNVFNNLAGGRIWGSLFFLFMLFAAFSTVLAVFENIVSCCMELFQADRKIVCIINAPVVFALSLPCTFGFNLFSGFAPMGAGSTILDLEDFILSKIILPLGSLVFLLFCTRKWGWGWDAFFKEANTGKGLKIQGWMKGYFAYVLPVIMLAVFLLSLFD